MRVAIGRALRVGPGDEVMIRGQLPEQAKLGRLFVFAKEGEADYSPYVVNVREKMVVGDMPQMLSPMTMRLDSYRRRSEVSFTADIDGYIRVMQEVDKADEPKAVVRLTRTVCPHLPWKDRMLRRLSGARAWIN
jgi:hypothetical protein